MFQEYNTPTKGGRRSTKEQGKKFTISPEESSEQTEQLRALTKYYERKTEYLIKHCLEICEAFTDNALRRDNQAAMAMLREVYNSRSWKATQPLRDAYEIVNRLQKRFNWAKRTLMRQQSR